MQKGGIPMLDTLIINGTVIDGSGKPAYSGAVGMKDGKLVRDDRRNIG